METKLLFFDPNTSHVGFVCSGTWREYDVMHGKEKMHHWHFFLGGGELMELVANITRVQAIKVRNKS